MAFEGPLYIDFKFDSRRACLSAYEALKLAISLSRWALTGVKIECLNELHTPGGLIKFIAENLQSEHSLRRPSLAAASDQSRGADRVALPAGREAPGNPDRPVDGNSSRPGFWYVPNTMSKVGSTTAKFRL